MADEIATLKRKRADLAGHIEHAQAAFSEMLANLAHLDATAQVVRLGGEDRAGADAGVPARWGC